MRRTPGSLALFVLPLLLALLAVGLAVPRLAAAFLLLPAHGIVEAAGKGEPVSDAALSRALAAKTAAFRWVSDPKTQSDIGTLHLLAAHRAGTGSPEGIRLLEESVTAIRASLGLSPAQPYAWLQLFQARLALEGPTAAASPLFVQAIRTAPTESHIVLPRLEVGLAVWAFLDAEAMRHLKGQVALAARYHLWPLTEMTKKRHALKLVREALEEDPELLNQFDVIYRRL